MLDEAFRQKRIPPVTIACAGVPPFCFYLDDPARGQNWETLVADRLLEEVSASFKTTKRAGLVGISMGGYGALKIAFSRPHSFSAVAAVAPMVEPALRAQDTPIRNRFHYPPEVPEQLLGQSRDDDLFKQDHPGNRAIDNVEEIRSSDLAISIDAGSRDALNAHDGAEFLHRILWDLDVPHEYQLLRDADHVGLSLVNRIEKAFSFVGEYLSFGNSNHCPWTTLSLP